MHSTLVVVHIMITLASTVAGRRYRDNRKTYHLYSKPAPARHTIQSLVTIRLPANRTDAFVKRHHFGGTPIAWPKALAQGLAQTKRRQSRRLHPLFQVAIATVAPLNKRGPEVEPPTTGIPSQTSLPKSHLVTLLDQGAQCSKAFPTEDAVRSRSSPAW